MRTALAGPGLDHGTMLNLKKPQVPHDYAGDFTVNDVWLYITVLWNTRPETVDRLIAARRGAVRRRVHILRRHDRGPRTPTTPWARIIPAVFAQYQLTLHGAEVNVLTRRHVAPTSG